MLIKPSILGLAGVLLALAPCARAESGRLGLGRAPTPAEITSWDIDVRADGAGLPHGHGTARAGAIVYANHCAACHGANGTEGPADRLVGGQGTLASAHPIRTVGSYWPYATTLFDFVRRAMPFNAPKSLSDNEIYAVCALILYRNGIIGEDTQMNETSLPRVRMPNHNGFTSPDPRPDTGPSPHGAR